MCVGAVLVAVARAPDTAAPPSAPNATATPAEAIATATPIHGADAGVQCSSNVDEVARLVDGTHRTVHAVIATIPDPLDSTVGWYLDDQLGAIEQGMNDARFVLQCYWLPWSPDQSADKHPPDVAATEPGVIVALGSTQDVLVLFVVGETPTSGIHTAAFTKALAVIQGHRWLTKDGRVQVLGPTFSGSASSLAVVLHDHADQSFEIVSGSATREATGHDLTSANADVKYSVVVNSSTAQMEALLAYLTSHDVDLGRTALLYESGTLYGSSLYDRSRGNPANNAPAIQIPFPLQISQLRTAYQRATATGAYKTSSTEAERGTDLSLGDVVVPRDRVPPMAPAITAASADLMLATILATLADAKVTHVIIVATDPRDTLFLAGRIRRYVPDVQLATFSSDLLYVHPDHRADVEGMIVATTYPLIANLQRWQRAWPHAPLLQFPRNAAEGAYNATLALLRPDGVDLVDYGPPPFAGVPGCGGRAPASNGIPPVWLTLVAHDRFLPLTACEPGAEHAGSLLVGDATHPQQPVQLPFPVLAAILIPGAAVSVLLGATRLRAGAWVCPGPPPRWLDVQLGLCWTGLIAASVLLIAYFARFIVIYCRAWSGSARIDEVLLYLRGADIGSGRSLIVLSTLIAIVFWIVGLGHLRRLWFVRAAALPNPIAQPDGPTDDLRGVCDDIADIARGTHPPDGPSLIGYCVVALAGIAVLIQLRLENGVFDYVVRGLLVVAFLLVSANGLHSVALWRKMHDLLRRLAAHPLAAAYTRLAGDATTRGLRGRFYARLPALYELTSVMDAWRTLAAVSTSMALERAAVAAAPDFGALPIDLDAAARLRDRLAEITAATTAFDVEMASGDPDEPSLQSPYATSHAFAVAGDVARMLEAVWRGFSVDARKAEPLVQWVTAAEDLAARTVTMYLGMLFTHLQNVLATLVAGAFLLVFIVLSYPFQPQSLLTTAAWVFAAAVVGTVLGIFVQMDRSDVLNRLSNTKSGELTFDRNLFGMVSRYILLPLTGLVATQIPQLGRFVDVVVRYLR